MDWPQWLDQTQVVVQLLKLEEYVVLEETKETKGITKRDEPEVPEYLEGPRVHPSAAGGKDGKYNICRYNSRIPSRPDDTAATWEWRIVLLNTEVCLVDFRGITTFDHEGHRSRY